MREILVAIIDLANNVSASILVNSLYSELLRSSYLVYISIVLLIPCTVHVHPNTAASHTYSAGNELFGSER